MQLIKGSNNVDTMQRMYAAVNRGVPSFVRGSMTKNVLNMGLVFDASQPVITSFYVRNFNLQYAKREWLWYLGADKFDDSIESHATMWKKLKQQDGSFYSNYGQYIFNRTGEVEGDPEISQFDYVIETLCSDPQSRRASMVLLKREHLFEDNSDVVCTYAINFTIEQGRLHMTVMMRSNDVIFGFTNDAFCFWNLYAFVYALVADRLAGTGSVLLHGNYTHFTNSMHVYERHFDMIGKLALTRTMAAYEEINVPWPSVAEVIQLVNSGGKEGSGEYVDWITS